MATEFPMNAVDRVSSSPGRRRARCRVAGLVLLTLGLAASAPLHAVESQCAADLVSASDRQDGDAFGYAVSMHEGLGRTLLAIGAPYLRDDEPDRSGFVEVFERVAGSWIFRARITAPDGAPARFGRALALTANGEGFLLAIGADGATYVTAGTSGSDWAPLVSIADDSLVTGRCLDADWNAEASAFWILAGAPAGAVLLEGTPGGAWTAWPVLDGAESINSVDLELAAPESFIALGGAFPSGRALLILEGASAGSWSVAAEFPTPAPELYWFAANVAISVIDGRAVCAASTEAGYYQYQVPSWIFLYERQSGGGWTPEWDLAVEGTLTGAPGWSYPPDSRSGQSLRIANVGDEHVIAFGMPLDYNNGALDGQIALFFGSWDRSWSQVLLPQAPKSGLSLNYGFAVDLQVIGATVRIAAGAPATDSPILGASRAFIQEVAAPRDCDGSGAADGCEIDAGAVADCNGNAVPDACDIAEGVSADENGDGVPDECDPDCNGNGLSDVVEIDLGLATDCNFNGAIDSCDIAGGASSDEDGNGVPDECETDCNANGIPDWLDVLFGLAPDCNGNGVPDECDLAAGTSTDTNLNGVPDECECLADLDGDGQTAFSDLLIVLAQWGPCPPVCLGDVDGDGEVGFADLLAVLATWGICPG